MKQACLTNLCLDKVMTTAILIYTYSQQNVNKKTQWLKARVASYDRR